MIPARHHLGLLGAVGLALIVGILLGSSTLPRVPGAPDPDPSGQVSDAPDRTAALRSQDGGGPGFVAAVAPAIVDNALASRRVLLVSTATANPGDRQAVADLLTRSGARVTGRLSLTPAFTDPARSNQLTELAIRLLPAGAQLPPTPQAGTLLGSLLGSLLLTDTASPADRADPQPSGRFGPASRSQVAAVLAGLADGGYLGSAPRVQPAQLVVVLTGAAPEHSAPRARAVADLATELGRAAGGAVVAGEAPDSGPPGAVRVLRAAPAGAAVSTVDHVGGPAGRVTAVLALAEQARGAGGHYGLGAAAQALVPASAG